jgi:hypothetical protein
MGKMHGKETVKPEEWFREHCLRKRSASSWFRYSPIVKTWLPLKAQIQVTSEHGRTTDKRATAPVRIDLQKPQLRLKIRQVQ